MTLKKSTGSESYKSQAAHDNITRASHIMSHSILIITPNIEATRSVGGDIGMGL